MRKKLYICDGKATGCRRTACAFNGTGDCMHTSDKSHARYRGPREWEVGESAGKTVLIEKAREL